MWIMGGKGRTAAQELFQKAEEGGKALHHTVGSVPWVLAGVNYTGKKKDHST